MSCRETIKTITRSKTPKITWRYQVLFDRKWPHTNQVKSLNVQFYGFPSLVF
jgi:hypothetical protein